MEKTETDNSCRGLEPLCEEHRAGLLFAARLRKGIQNGTSIGRIRDFVGWYWRKHIRPHFFQEEKVLLPQLPGNALTEKVRADHERIRELIIDIDHEPSRRDILMLASLVEKHIQFEEEELFRFVEEHLDRSVLTGIQLQLSTSEVTQEEWRNQFWN